LYNIHNILQYQQAVAPWPKHHVMSCHRYSILEYNRCSCCLGGRWIWLGCNHTVNHPGIILLVLHPFTSSWWHTDPAFWY